MIGEILYWVPRIVLGFLVAGPVIVGFIARK